MSTTTTHIETEKQLLPELRFKEFEGDWNTKKLSDIYKINAGGDIDVNHVSQIKTEKYQYPIYANARKGKGFYAYSDIYKVEPNTVTIAGRGAHLGIAHARDHRFYPIVRLLVLKPLNEEDIHFSECAINRINLFIESTGVPQLTAPQISGYTISLPALPEQQKIASFLSAVDEKIQQLTKKKALLEQYKKGVMQQLFSGQLRFKDENGNDYPDWEEKRLGEVFKFKQGYQFAVEEQSEEPFDNSVEFVRIINVTSSPEDKRYVVDPGVEFHLNKEDLFMVRYGDAGKIVCGFNGIIANNMFRLLPLIDLSKKWHYFYLDFIYDKIHALAGSSTMPAIKFGTISGLEFMSPCFEEQQKIATYLSRIDTKIEAVNNQITQTQTFKKGLLKQMFV